MSDTMSVCSSKSIFGSNNCCIRSLICPDLPNDFHANEFYELIIVVKGNCMFRYKDTLHTIKKGDVFIIPPMIGHKYIDITGFGTYHILFSSTLFENYREESSGVNGFSEFIGERTNFQERILHFGGKQLQRICDDFFADFYLGNAYAHTPPIRIHALYRFLYYFSELLLQQLYSSPSDVKNNYLMRMIGSYIAENIGEKLTIEHLCKKALLSRSSFIQSFRQVYGVPPMTYIAKCRAEKAEGLIAKTKMSKSEIAQMCGYYDVSHMEKMIKKQSAIK